ncbi:helix-turn-helix domain-containing protein [Saccharopolyspora sp. NPDC003752]
MSDETFGAALRRYRRAADLSQRDLAQQLYIAKSTVSRWESGDTRPDAATVAKLDAELDAHGNLKRAHAAEITPPVLAPRLDCGQPVSADYVAELHTAMHSLVSLDGLHGGVELAPFAARLFRSANRTLAAGNYPADLESDFTAVTAELGEVAGWLAFDAENQDAARHHWLEALHLAQLTGDRNMELFILGNLALQAQHRGHPGEALRICTRMENAYRLSPRLQVMVAMRRARAAADLGHGNAVDLIRRARVDADNSIAATDPKWSWWINGSEVAAHEAGVYRSIGDWASAVDTYARSLDHVPNSYRWFRYIGGANLLEALVHVRDWTEAERVAGNLLGLADDINSGRAATHLRRAARTAKRHAAPESVIELLGALATA